MNTRDRIRESFKQLVERGHSVNQNNGWDGTNYHRFPPSDVYLSFRTEALNLIRRSCGSDSDHYLELRRIAEGKVSATNGFYFSRYMGVLMAAQNDFEANLLFDMRSIIAAEVIGDFFDQSEQLLAAGYHIPAASLTGAILEDTLRKLSEKHGLELPERTKIDRLNADLVKANVYDKLIQKRITALADIRNNADHGHFDKFRREDVDDMVQWVRRFSADYLQ